MNSISRRSIKLNLLRFFIFGRADVLAALFFLIFLSPFINHISVDAAGVSVPVSAILLVYSESNTLTAAQEMPTMHQNR